MSLALPTSARLGITRQLGAWFDQERRNGVELKLVGGMVVQDIWKDGVKFYTIEWPIERAEQAAELFYQGAQKARRAGASAPIASKPSILHR